MNRIALALVTAVLGAVAPTCVAAQAVTDSGTAPAVAVGGDTTGLTGGLRPLRVAKWSTLVAATAAGIYGFVENSRADDRFAELERLCEAQRFECGRRTGDGAYADPALEDLYQTVRRHDRRAHYALVAGQIGVAASVGLFLLDLGNVRRPDDVPWVPGTLRLERGPREIRLSLNLPVGNGRD